jgi:hypothetical protein
LWPDPAPITASEKPNTGKMPRLKIKAAVRFAPTGATTSPSSVLPSMA